jgi:hypothetical protein
MLQQILTRTPLYVWAILAGLIYRGYLASKDREVVFWKLFIIPAIMPLLTVPDLTLKFGHAGQSVAIWAGAAALVTLLTWQFSRARVSPAAQAGNVLVRGTWLPLVAMLGIFFTKYAVNVMLAINPQARGDVLFAAACCALFGVFNGVFFGWAARDATSYLQTPARAIS